jgi:hypothetical protein
VIESQSWAEQSEIIQVATVEESGLTSREINDSKESRTGFQPSRSGVLRGQATIQVCPVSLREAGPTLHLKHMTFARPGD